MILALDLAGVVGWAAGRKGDNPPLMGAVPLRNGTSYGLWLMGFENLLIDLIEEHRPTLIAAEAPLPLKAQTRDSTARDQFGLAAYCHGEAARYGIEVREYKADDVRRKMLGRCRLTAIEKAAGMKMKDPVMAWCRDRGWKPSRHDAADAAMLWAYVTSG